MKKQSIETSVNEKWENWLLEDKMFQYVNKRYL
jgi:hypothetical protein